MSDLASHDGLGPRGGAGLTPAQERGVLGRAPLAPPSRIRRGEPMIWLTGSALGLCILMIAGLIGVILTNGLSSFWPRRLELVTLKDGAVFLGELVRREAIPEPGNPELPEKHRIQLRVGNRDLLGFDFKWIDEDDIAKRELPHGVYFVERREYGPLLGTPVLLKDGERELAQGVEAVSRALPALLEKAAADRAGIRGVEKGQIGDINYEIERDRLRLRKLDYQKKLNPALDQAGARAEIAKDTAGEKTLYGKVQEDLAKVVERASATEVTFKAAA